MDRHGQMVSMAWVKPLEYMFFSDEENTHCWEGVTRGLCHWEAARVRRFGLPPSPLPPPLGFAARAPKDARPGCASWAVVWKKCAVLKKVCCFFAKHVSPFFSKHNLFPAPSSRDEQKTYQSTGEYSVRATVFLLNLWNSFMQTISHKNITGIQTQSMSNNQQKSSIPSRVVFCFRITQSPFHNKPLVLFEQNRQKPVGLNQWKSDLKCIETQKWEGFQKRSKIFLGLRLNQMCMGF